jgi:hypothetical protein
MQRNILTSLRESIVEASRGEVSISVRMRRRTMRDGPCASNRQPRMDRPASESECTQFRGLPSTFMKHRKQRRDRVRIIKRGRERETDRQDVKEGERGHLVGLHEPPAIRQNKSFSLCSNCGRSWESCSKNKCIQGTRMSKACSSSFL